MRNTFLKTALAISTLCLLSACTDAKLRFAPSDIINKADDPREGDFDVPVLDPTPTPVTPPSPTPPPDVVPPGPTPAPTPVAQDDCEVQGLSQKACYLMKVMELGCPLRDRMPASYRAPDRAEIVANMELCDDTAYPATSPTAAQLELIKRLLDPNDDRFRKYIFTGRYDKPPYTDDFKKFFGIELYNANYVFCDNNGLPPSMVVPREGINNDGFMPDKDYQAASGYAQQLRQCVWDSKRH